MYPFAKEETKEHVDASHVLPRLKYTGPYKKHIDIADYYGFRLLKPVRISKGDKENKGPTDRVAFVRTYLERGLDTCTPPVQLCYTTKAPYKQDVHFRLEIAGTDESFAEILLIKTALVILRESGFTNLRVRLNSIGRRDAAENFTREFLAHCRKNIENFHETCRHALKEDPMSLLGCTHEMCQDIIAQGPQSIGFLSEASRRHFYEILEALETFDVPYSIDNSLVGDRYSTTRTIFEIITGAPDTEPLVLAQGERYDRLAHYAGFGRKMPVAGLTLLQTQTRGKTAQERFKEYKISTTAKPKVHIVQLGPVARYGALDALETLRKASVPVSVSLANHTLSEQLAHAKQMKTPVIVIIGHKEAVENTAIIRNEDTRAQVTIPRHKIPTFLKRLKV